MSLKNRISCGFLFCALVCGGLRGALAANVAVIDTSSASNGLGVQWCQLLQDNGHQCTIFPNSGATTSELAPFQVIIDLSYAWSDPDGVLADAMRARKGVVTWGDVPDTLEVYVNPMVQAWIGANDMALLIGAAYTTAHDPILGSLPPGTYVGGCADGDGCTALYGTSGHSEAKVLATVAEHTDRIAILRNFWEGGQSIYISQLIAPWGGQLHHDIILDSVNVLSRPIPTLSVETLFVLALAILVGGVLVLGRRHGKWQHRSFVLGIGLVLGVSNTKAQTPTSTLSINTADGVTTMRLGTGAPFHTTTDTVANARTISVPNSPILLILWNQSNGGDAATNWYVISLDGASVDKVSKTSYALKLRYADYDPAGTQPSVPDSLTAGPDSDLSVVQFITQPLDEFRSAIAAAGGTIYHYLPNHSYLIRMDSSAREQIVTLPYVRAIVPFHPAYRVDPTLIPALLAEGNTSEPIRYSIAAISKAEAVRSALFDRLASLNSSVEDPNPGSFRIEAMLTKEQLLSLLQSDQVLFVEKAKGAGSDMDIVRAVCGANYVESTTAYSGYAGDSGQGVRGEVLDNVVREDHVAFKHPNNGYPIIHDSNSTGCTSSHGTSTYGIIFGNGLGESSGQGRGLLPYGEGIFSSTGGGVCDNSNPTYHCGTQHLLCSRGDHTAELVDANQNYKAVFQSNSWGHNVTTKYDGMSQEMDEILFENDILICQSQGNCGDAVLGCDNHNDNCACDDGDGTKSCSRPEAWAKNIVSVGGVRHFNSTDNAKYEWCQSVNNCNESTCPTCDCGYCRVYTCQGQTNCHLCDHLGSCCPLGTTNQTCDACACCGHGPCESCGTSQCASRGGAADGRIKPDLVHFTDCIHTTCAADDSCYSNGPEGIADFGGSSAAAPITCGMFGLFFQMWADDTGHTGYGVFGNSVVSCNLSTENCVFKRRPHMTTAKAMMINTAFLTSQTDFSRDNHGWGMADVGRLYSRRNNFPIICDECRVLSQSDATATYTVTVTSGALALRATMTYADPAGDPESTVSVVNDLDLKVTSPSGAVYWGNCGSRGGDWSLSTCTDDHPYPDSPDNEIEILDTVENVFLQNPQAGTWTINVIADVIAQDGHVETEATDVDFALVVSLIRIATVTALPIPRTFAAGPPIAITTTFPIAATLQAGTAWTATSTVFPTNARPRRVAGRAEVARC